MLGTTSFLKISADARESGLSFALRLRGIPQLSPKHTQGEEFHVFNILVVVVKKMIIDSDVSPLSLGSSQCVVYHFLPVLLQAA